MRVIDEVKEEIQIRREANNIDSHYGTNKSNKILEKLPVPRKELFTASDKRRIIELLIAREEVLIPLFKRMLQIDTDKRPVGHKRLLKSSAYSA